MRPQATGHAPAGLDLIEDERHVVNLRQQPQLAHESCACPAHATFALNRLDEHSRDATRSTDDIGREVRALPVHERLEVLIRPRKEFVERVHLPLEGIDRFLGPRQPSRHQQIP